MGHDEELKVYDQLCISYRAIDDFRAKLLGFLPLVSGSGIFLLLNDAFTDATRTHLAPQFLRPISDGSGSLDIRRSGVPTSWSRARNGGGSRPMTDLDAVMTS
jgi:hypothetical protein